MFLSVKFLVFLVLLSSASAFPSSAWRWCELAEDPRVCRREALGFTRAVLRNAVDNFRRNARQGPASSVLLDAIRNVESAGHCFNQDPCRITGDGGLALGPYQIHRVYYQDAVQFRPSLAKRPYEDVAYDDFARQIIQAYMSRYATARRLGHSPTDEDIARIHNGGPNGFRSSSTLGYWQKVRSQLNAMRG